MDLRSTGVLLSGAEMLDSGIRQTRFIDTDEGSFLVATTGRGGGLISYEHRPDGTWVLRDEAYFSGALLDSPLETLALTTGPDGPLALVGGDAEGLWCFALNPDGSFGPQDRLSAAEAAPLVADAAAGMSGDDATASLALQAQIEGLPLPEGIALSAAPQFVRATVAERSFLLATDSASQALFVYDLQDNGPSPGPGALRDRFGAAEGLGVANPTALASVEIEGTTFVLMAAAGSASLSVLRLSGSGQLTLTDHVIDTLETRFAAAQTLEVFQQGGQTFVLSGGGDHGLTLFSLLPNGRLITRESLADTEATSLHNVTDVTAQVVDDQLVIAATSQRDAGISLLELDIGSLRESWRNESGETRNKATGSGDDILIAGAQGDTIRGGAGDDILVAGPGRTIMQGGAGRDTFVLTDQSTNGRITDFEAGVDRIDLSFWPMLRAPQSLDVTETSTGARLSYRGYELSIQAEDRQTLTLLDLFGPRFDWADRLPLPDPPPATAPLAGETLRAPDTGAALSGGAGNDKLYGADGFDTLSGGAGDDLLVGKDGADRLSAGSGDDTLYGNDGADNLQAEAGRNLLSGGNGNDTLSGGSDDDTLRGGTGNDIVMAGAGDDSLRGDSGNDSLYGNDGDDLLRGSGGRNLLSGGNGDDKLYGAERDDTLEGGGGNDLLFGGDGDDSLTGGAGSDTLYGKDGEDVLRATSGPGFLSGGDDDDRIFGGDQDDTIQGGRGDDLLVGGAGDDSLRADSGRDTLFGNDGDDLMRATSGASQMSGGRGDDKLIGADQADLLSGGNGADLVVGGSGHDRVSGDKGDDTLYGNKGNDTIEGGDGDDWASGGTGNDRLFGREGNDTMRGSDGADVFFGGAARDVLAGNGGNDTIEGGSDNDRLFGGSGNDRLIGGTGADVLGGGSGADVFVFNFVNESRQGAGTRDRIEDFTSGVDQIDLSALASGLEFVTSYTGAGREVRYNEAIGRLYVDIDGDGSSDFAVDLRGAPSLDADDLIL
ncbi:calcium-binding protein [Primorskyibacter sp. S187A]|uniref:calcium-binding protein n=1 Tax=Primorskyibacter sp. S187A TaxID=3415130 RepID=UPI003C7BDAF4